MLWVLLICHPKFRAFLIGFDYAIAMGGSFVLLLLLIFPEFPVFLAFLFEFVVLMDLADFVF